MGKKNPENNIDIRSLVNVHVIAANATTCENYMCYRNSMQGASTTWPPNWPMALLERKLYPVLWQYEDKTKQMITSKRSKLHFRIWDRSWKKYLDSRLLHAGCEWEQSIPSAPAAAAGLRTRCLNLILKLAWFSSMNEHIAKSLPLQANDPHCDCSRINVPRFHCSFKKVLKNTVRQSNTQGTYTREQQSH